MAVFGRSQSVNEGFDFSAEVNESKYTPEAHGSFLAESFAIIAESEANYASLMKSVGIYELQYFEENGTELVYEAGQMSGFISKLKEFFLKLWEKIKGLFKKFIAMIDQFVLSDKDFIKRYRETLLKIDTRDFKYNGYRFTVGAVDIKGAVVAVDGIGTKHGLSTSGATASAAGLLNLNGKQVDYAKFTGYEDTNDTLSNKKEDILEEMRGSAIGKGKLTTSEYAEELHKILRNNEDAPEEIEGVSVTDLIQTIDGYKSAKKVADDAMKAIEKSINETIKELQRLEKDLAKVTPQSTDNADTKKAKATTVRYISNVYGMQKEGLNIIQTANGALLTALKDNNRQAKAICVKLINYKPKNEGAGFSEGGDFLSDVNFK